MFREKVTWTTRVLNRSIVKQRIGLVKFQGVAEGCNTPYGSAWAYQTPQVDNEWSDTHGSHRPSLGNLKGIQWLRLPILSYVPEELHRIWRAIRVEVFPSKYRKIGSETSRWSGVAPAPVFDSVAVPFDEDDHSRTWEEKWCVSVLHSFRRNSSQCW